MGLGKTRLCCAFLAGALGSRLIQRAIVVVPTTLLDAWTKELTYCGISTVSRYHGTAKT